MPALHATETADRLTCPVCDGALRWIAGQGAPEAGDYLLCFGCRCWLVLGRRAARLMSDGEWITLPAHTRIRLTGIRDGLAAEKRAR